MSDAGTATPAEVMAEHIARNPDATLSDALQAGVGPLGVLAERYPARLDALKRSHTEWVRQGRPANVRPIALVATEPEVPTPAPAPVVNVPAPDPSEVPDLRSLVAMGVHRFNAFVREHPEEFRALKSRR